MSQQSNLLATDCLVVTSTRYRRIADSFGRDGDSLIVSFADYRVFDETARGAPEALNETYGQRSITNERIPELGIADA
jgi:hypothetical protein